MATKKQYIFRQTKGTDKKKTNAEDLGDVDVIVFDIQDVGVRFFTYISSLEDLSESAIEHNKPLIVLHRPNPNGHYVDGPVRQDGFRSFLGMQKVPVVYGMTIGEYAMMLKGENSEKVIKNIKERIETIRYTLPEGVVIEPFLDRTKMVDNAIGTVEKNLLEGSLIVIFILILFLGNIRAGLLVASLTISTIFSR